ncbi:MAG: SufD family Fe-S cluster assembly protein [Rhodobacteraceae bacterium]|nr:SufD family Fe-S cluster assembly protein [Paracoccaceae bacterium]
MSAPNPRTVATEALLDTLKMPEGGCIEVARRAALARLRAMGLPQRRDEYWKFTKPDTLLTAEVPPAAPFDNEEGLLFDEFDRLKIVFVDGVFDPQASDDLSLEGVSFDRLEDICCTDIHWAKDIYGVLETRGQTPVPRPFAALNTAFATDGIAIHVTGRPSKPISLIYIHGSRASDAILHHVIRVESGAEVTILENGPAAARLNECMEIDIADGGTLHHVRAQGRDPERRAVTAMFTRLGKQSVFKSFTVTVNGALTRNESVIELIGDDGVAHVAGACVGDAGGNRDFHHDDTVFVTHDALNCESRQVFKKVLRNGATGVFQGKILVKAGAQKTDGYQISQALLLDDDSQFLAKPELEIYADDVICSHGSTTGAIDETALFYLRSRGVPQKEATNLLTLSFLAEAVDEIEDKALAEDIRSRLENWLSRRG